LDLKCGEQLWYSAQLRALKEPSLFQLASNALSHSYRFLWLRTFNHPIAIRVDIKPAGTGALTTKVTSGAGVPRQNSVRSNSIVFSMIWGSHSVSS
jgi:hypothetical protein